MGSVDGVVWEKLGQVARKVERFAQQKKCRSVGIRELWYAWVQSDSSAVCGVPVWLPGSLVQGQAGGR